VLKAVIFSVQCCASRNCVAITSHAVSSFKLFDIHQLAPCISYWQKHVATQSPEFV